MKGYIVAKKISKLVGGYCYGVYFSCEDNQQGLGRIPSGLLLYIITRGRIL